MGLILWVALAWAGRWDDRASDVEASRVVASDPEQIRGVLSNVHVFEQVLPERCASDFVYGQMPEGVGASVKLTYHATWMHRRLQATLIRSEPDRVEYDHLGDRGFVTRWVLEPVEEGTRVTVTTYVNPPPRPLKKIFYTQIRPAWTQCYVEALESLAGRVPSRAVTNDEGTVSVE